MTVTIEHYNRTRLRWATDDPVTGRLVVAAGSRPRPVTGPVAAWNLYQSGRLPALRQRFGTHPAHRDRIRVLTLDRGLLHADEPVLAPPERVITPQQLGQLRRLVSVQLAAEVLRPDGGLPNEVLLLGDAVCLRLIVDLFLLPDHRPRLHWFGDHLPWTHVTQVFDRWGWPR